MSSPLQAGGADADSIPMQVRRRLGPARLRMLLTAGVLAAAVGGAATATGVLDAPEHAALDRLFQQRPATAPADVAVVAIDDVTFSDLHRHWPFPRSLFAQAVDRLHQAGASEVVLDVQFTEPTKRREDLALYDAVARAGGAVLATSETNDRGQANVLGGADSLSAIGAQAAAANLPDETGGVIRRFSPAIGGLPTIAAVVAERAGRPVAPSSFGPGGALIDFRGPPGTIPTYSLSSLLAGRVDPARLRGRVVVIGATAPTLNDLHATPQGADLMSGPEVQANAIWTTLHGLPLHSAPGWLDALAILVAALAVPLLATRVRAVLAALAAPVVGAGYVAVAQIAFEHGTVLVQAGPIAALALASVATVAVSHLLETVERQRIAEVNDLLEEQVRARTADLRATELEIVQRLGQAVESRDEETGEHIARIAELSHRLALAAGLPAEDAELLRRASAMHDVGKIAIPDSILGKPGPLSGEERRIMQSHTTIGADMLAGSRSPLVQLGETIARTHHERWDGEGYPAALAGEDIPLVGRICAVCDVFDALVSTRPYKHAWSLETALAEIRRQRGRHFDPRLVDLFLAIPEPELRGIGAAAASHKPSVHSATAA
jgi:HD-GYP domain-containing protein (c-di-GMP phosphodiesterase class II)